MSRQTLGWTIAILWFAVSAIAIFVSYAIAIVSSMIRTMLLGTLQTEASESIVIFITAFGGFTFLSTALLGTAQGLLLRQRQPGMNEWIGATVTGGIVAIAITLIVALTTNVAVAQMFAPSAYWLGVAIGQWFILKHYSSRAIAWLIAGLLMSLLALKMHPVLSAVPLVYGGVTGYLLVWILRSRQPILIDPQ